MKHLQQAVRLCVCVVVCLVVCVCVCVCVCQDNIVVIDEAHNLIESINEVHSARSSAIRVRLVFKRICISKLQSAVAFLFSHNNAGRLIVVVVVVVTVVTVVVVLSLVVTVVVVVVVVVVVTVVAVVVAVVGGATVLTPHLWCAGLVSAKSSGRTQRCPRTWIDTVPG
jgi:hypothetical protein